MVLMNMELFSYKKIENIFNEIFHFGKHKSNFLHNFSSNSINRSPKNIMSDEIILLKSSKIRFDYN